MPAPYFEGVAGPMSVQRRQDRNGAFKALEINLRATGGTLARFLRGMDELYLIIKAFVPGASFQNSSLMASMDVSKSPGNITPTRYSTRRSRF